uniref:Uncharacterized protein n=1 Tax=Oryza glumipatula TaxID=40148 RepID=A0A0E0BJN1_9ORYZ
MAADAGTWRRARVGGGEERGVGRPEGEAEMRQKQCDLGEDWSDGHACAVRLSSDLCRPNPSLWWAFFGLSRWGEGVLLGQNPAWSRDHLDLLVESTVLGAPANSKRRDPVGRRVRQRSTHRWWRKSAGSGEIATPRAGAPAAEAERGDKKLKTITTPTSGHRCIPNKIILKGKKLIGIEIRSRVVGWSFIKIEVSWPPPALECYI